jgi:hypothetical protein
LTGAPAAHPTTASEFTESWHTSNHSLTKL